MLSTLTNKIAPYGKLIVAALSAVAVVLCSFSIFFGNLQYSYYGGVQLKFPNFFSLVTLFFSLVVPCALMVVFMFKVLDEKFSKYIATAVFGLVAVFSFFSFIGSVFGFFQIIISALTNWDYAWDIISSSIWNNISGGFFNLLMTVAFGLATYSALKGFEKKLFFYVAVGVGVVTQIISFFTFLFSIVGYIDMGFYLSLFTSPAGIIGRIAFYLAILVFGVLNTFAPILNSKKKAEVIEAEATVIDAE